MEERFNNIRRRNDGDGDGHGHGDIAYDFDGTFQQQALEICLPNSDYDPNTVPTTGEEYLTHMAYERKRTPAIVSRRPKLPDIQNSSSSSSLVNHVRSASIQTNDEFTAQLRDFAARSMEMLPTDEWKAIQVDNFEKTRNKINEIRIIFQANDNLELPLSDDNAIVWLNFCRQHPPALSTILKIGQRDLELLLDIVCEWLQCNEKQKVDDDANGMENSSEDGNYDASQLKLTARWLGEWLYALLACLHLPLEPEVHSTLREIARICVRQRGQLIMPEDAKHVMTYNIFIQLIANVFGQLDFAEFI